MREGVFSLLLFMFCLSSGRSFLLLEGRVRRSGRGCLFCLLLFYVLSVEGVEFSVVGGQNGAVMRELVVLFC